MRTLFRAGVTAVMLSSAALVLTSTPTAHAAPQGTCTTGSYTETTTGSDTVGVFKATQVSGAYVTTSNCSWTVPSGVSSVRVLVVAGGGSGGMFHTSGGGGAGGLIHEVGYEVTPGSSISVTVGKGGDKGPTAGNVANNSGNDGDNSVFGSLTAVGGGGGGGGGSNSQIGNPGRAGGSGGGGGRCWVSCNTSLVTSNANFRAGGVGTAGQGHDGAKSHFMAGSGGGGAGGPGTQSVGGTPGNGGPGLFIDITGTATPYAGGGGGGHELSQTKSSGGSGIGGGGGGVWQNGMGDAGAPHTGSGGGASGQGGEGGIGGSGIVIIRWGSAPTSPNIALSSSSGTAVLNTVLTSSDLYSITNSGAAATSYSISPALPTGLTFDTTSGLISGTPTQLSSATTYTITAHNLNTANGASSRSSRTFTLTVASTAPTTTTTTTTSTTIPVTTTTTPTNTTTTTAPNLLLTTSGVSSTTSIVSSSSQAVTARVQMPQALASGVPQAVAAVTTTTSTTTTTVPAPDAPDLESGEAAAIIDGEAVNATVIRRDNALTFSVAGLEATVWGVSAEGERIALDPDGNLNLTNSDSVQFEASGFATNTDVDIWVYSTPIRLATMSSDAAGEIAGIFPIPVQLEEGEHRLVFDGRAASGNPVTMAVGLQLGSFDPDGVSPWVFIIPISLAIIIALVIPTRSRRRKKSLQVV